MSTSQRDSETLAEPLVLRGVAAVSPAGRKAYPGVPRAADHGIEKHSTWRKLCSTRKREKKSEQVSLSRKSNAIAGKSVLSRSTSVLGKGVKKQTKWSQGDPKASPACGPTREHG